MAKFLQDSTLQGLLPAAIADDKQIQASAAALTPMLQTLAKSLPNLLVFARLGKQDPASMLPPFMRLIHARGSQEAPASLAPLSAELVEQLAWQFHVDFREVATSIEELARMTQESIMWHRLKGTPAGMKMAFALFGMSVNIDEGGHGIHWARYQLGFDEIRDLSFVNQAWKIALEMQPARCQLFRLYTEEYNIIPLVYSEGKWSEHLYSDFSGVPASVIGDVWQGNDDLQLSFGVRHVFETEKLRHHHGARFFGLSRQGFETPYLDYPVWSYFSYSDVFPEKYGFVVSQLLSFDWCEKIYSSGTWKDGGWDDRTWTLSYIWDRYLPAWRMSIFEHRAIHAQARAQKPIQSAVLAQCNHTAPYIDAAKHTFTLHVNLSMMSEENRLLLAWRMNSLERRSIHIPPCAQPPASAGIQQTGFATPPYHNTGWASTWKDGYWNNYRAHFSLKSM